MKYYRTDGSVIEDFNDVDFGWNLNDIIIDESVPAYEERNKEIRNFALLQKKLDKEKLMDSMISENEFIMENEHVSNPSLCVVPEENKKGPKRINVGLRPEDINLETPSKENIIDLINPFSVEGKILTAVMSQTKYKNLNPTEAFRRTPINHRATNFRFYVNDQTEDSFENELYKEIENYHANKEANMSSLMMELVLNDLNCTINDFSDKSKDDTNSELYTSDLGNSITSGFENRRSPSPPERDHFNYMNNKKTEYLAVPNRSEVLSSLGLNDEDKSIQSFYEETPEMYLEIRETRDCFKSLDNKVTKLIEEANTLHKNLKEVNYLDNLIDLLNSKTENIKLEKSPFKIFLDPLKSTEDLNFIV